MALTWPTLRRILAHPSIKADSSAAVGAASHSDPDRHRVNQHPLLYQPDAVVRFRASRTARARYGATHHGVDPSIPRWFPARPPPSHGAQLDTAWSSEELQRLLLVVNDEWSRRRCSGDRSASGSAPERTLAGRPLFLDWLAWRRLQQTHFPDRTAHACYYQSLTLLRQASSMITSSSTSTTSNSTTTAAKIATTLPCLTAEREWTPEQDQCLVECVQRCQTHRFGPPPVWPPTRHLYQWRSMAATTASPTTPLGDHARDLRPRLWPRGTIDWTRVANRVGKRVTLCQLRYQALCRAREPPFLRLDIQ